MSNEIWRRFDAAFDRMGSMFDTMGDAMDEFFDGIDDDMAEGETETTTHEEETRPDGTRIVRTTTVRIKASGVVRPKKTTGATTR